MAKRREKDTGANDPRNGQLLPPEGHEKVGQYVMELLDVCLAYKVEHGLHEKWIREAEIIDNEPWRSDPGDVPLVKVNLIHPHREKVVNFLTDNNPTFNVKGDGGLEEGDQDKIKNISATCENWWIEQELQDTFTQSADTHESHGCVAGKLFFNPEAEYGMGEVEVDDIDPYYFAFWPTNTRKIQKAKAIFHFKPQSLFEARHEHPDFADDILSDAELINQLGDERRDGLGGQNKENEGLLVRMSGVVSKLVGFTKQGEDAVDECLAVECWVKDYTKERVKQPQPQEGVTDDFGRPVEGMTAETEVQQDKYPGNIRYVKIYNGGELVVADVKNPSINFDLPEEYTQRCFLYDKFPFTFTAPGARKNKPWGMSDIEQLQTIAFEFQKALSQLNIAKDSLARQIILNPATSGVKNEDFTNAEGIINPINAMEAQAIGYMAANIPLSDVMAAVQIYKSLFQMVAGSFDQEQAREGENQVIAYKALALLLERTAHILKKKLRADSKMIREWGRMYISLAQNWYQTKRWISVGDEQVEIDGQALMIPARIGVISGSTMPVSEVQRREESVGLYKMQGLVDQRYMLEMFGIDNPDEIIQRMKEGPLGEFIARLGVMLPKEVVQQLVPALQADEKEFKKALEKGGVGPVQIAPDPVEQQRAQARLAFEQEQARLAMENKNLENRKLEAEAYLLIEKAVTEMVEQNVKKEGVDLDWASIDLKRTELMDKISKGTFKMGKDAQMSDVKAVGELAKAKATTQGPYREAGMKSNNKKTGE